MELLLWAVAVVLLVNLLLGLVRVARGPAPADRMLAAQLFGTLGVAILLVLAHAGSSPTLRDVAVVLALTAPVAAVAFVRRQEKADDR